MTNPEAFLTGLLYFFWAWRIGSFLYSSYSVSESVTPSCAGTGVKLVVMVLLMSSSLLLHLVPLAEFPRLSLANRIISVPSQLNSLYFLHRYVGPTLDSKRVTTVLCIVSVVSIIETIYMINVDWNRIE